MERMKTEKATSRWDLPHDYDTKGAVGVCRCGRRESNTLHLPDRQLVEHASASTRIETEKGTI